MNRVLIPATCLTAILLLQGCSPPSEPTAATETAVSPAPAAGVDLPAVAAAPATTFNTSNTVRDIMNLMVEANARQLWNAVSYVATAEGVEETQPQTDADWQRLRANAVALVEAGNALMLPGRVVDTAANLADYDDFMYTPLEIEALIRRDPESWAYDLQEMQAATLLTLAAIDERDLLRFTEQAATINQACVSCHSRYWYRPVPMQGNEGLR